MKPGTGPDRWRARQAELRTVADHREKIARSKIYTEHAWRRWVEAQTESARRRWAGA